MTAPVVEAAVRRSWPAPRVRAEALGEWLRLQVALVELEYPPACADEPERWWSTRAQEVSWAQMVCGFCPVRELRELCRAYAIAAHEGDGVWGGLAPADRVGVAAP